jgi:glycosyltransferase involved in cell wall biosynthesis
MERIQLSVVMPLYNAERFVAEAVASVLREAEVSEVVVVDDGSTDGSLHVLSSFDNPRLRVLRNPSNLGIAASLRIAIAATHGDFVAFHDADDVSLPGRFARQLAAFSSGVAAVAVAQENMDADGNPLPTRRAWHTPAVLAHYLHFNNAVGGFSRVVVRRDALVAAGLGDTRLAVDYDLWTRLSPHGSIVSLPFIGVRYRVHDGGVTARHHDQQRRDIFTISRRMLTQLLGCPLRDDEFSAVASMWIGSPSRSPSLAHNLLREAHARFPGTPLELRCIHHETARRFARCAVALLGHLRFFSALRHLYYGCLWNPAHTLRTFTREFTRAAALRFRR